MSSAEKPVAPLAAVLALWVAPTPAVLHPWGVEDASQEDTNLRNTQLNHLLICFVCDL